MQTWQTKLPDMVLLAIGSMGRGRKKEKVYILRFYEGGVL